MASAIQMVMARLLPHVPVHIVTVNWTNIEGTVCAYNTATAGTVIDMRPNKDHYCKPESVWWIHCRLESFL